MSDNPNAKKPTVDPEVLNSVSRVNPWASVRAIAFDWTCIATAITLSVWLRHPLVYVLSVIVIGARQHGLGVLMHEGAHIGLFRNRKLNDLVSEMFVSWPIFISTHAYRLHHFAHHRHTNTDQDPDYSFYKDRGPEWTFPQKSRNVLKSLVRDVLGLNTPKFLKNIRRPAKTEAQKRPNGGFPALRLAYYLVIATILTLTNAWLGFLLLWVVPMLTWLTMVARLRSIAEHWGIDGHEGTRTTKTSWLGRFLLAPHNVNYHVEHHLFPAARFHALPQLHKELVAAGTFERDYRLSQGYLSVINECAEPLRIRQAS